MFRNNLDEVIKWSLHNKDDIERIFLPLSVKCRNSKYNFFREEKNINGLLALKYLVDSDPIFLRKMFVYINRENIPEELSDVYSKIISKYPFINIRMDAIVFQNAISLNDSHKRQLAHSDVRNLTPILLGFIKHGGTI
jgi:hypothetical protein